MFKKSVCVYSTHDRSETFSYSLADFTLYICVCPFIVTHLRFIQFQMTTITKFHFKNIFTCY